MPADNIPHMADVLPGDWADSRHMNNTASPVRRIGALAGFAGSVLYVLGNLLPGSIPRPDASSARIGAFFVHKRDSLLAGFTLELIALGLFLCFLGQLRTVMGDSRDSARLLAATMTAAWVVLTATVLVGSLPALALIWQGPPLGEPGLVRMAYEMEILATYAGSSTAAVVSVGAPSLVIWRTGILPRWLAVLGIAEIIANLFEIFGLFSRHGSLAGGYIDGVGALLWVLWVAAASVCLAWRAAETASR